MPKSAPPSRPSSPARALEPAAWFFIGALALLAFGLLIQPLGDPDVFIHLRDGRHWIESHFRVANDPFSYTASEKPFDRIEAWFRIGLYSAWTLAGYDGLIVGKALLMTAALGLLGILIYRRWRNLGATAVLLGLAALAPMSRLFPERPYIFTYLFLPLVLLILEAEDAAPSSPAPHRPWLLWSLPLLVIPWVNLHPGFMVLFVFLGARLLSDGLAYLRKRGPEVRSRLLRLSAVTGLCLLAGALNPLGFSIYRYVVEHLGSREFMTFITEWKPPTVGGEPVFFILLGLAWAAQAANWRRTKLTDLLPLAVFSYMAATAYRNIPLFVIAALPPLAGHANDLRARWFPRAQIPVSRRRLGLWAGGAAALALLGIAAASGWAFRPGLLPAFYPEAGLRWLEEQRFQGRLLTHDIWGGYTGWQTHGRVKVFMDGRLPTFGEALYRDYRKMIWGDETECRPLLARYQIEGVLVSPKNDIGLFRQLWMSGEWSLVYWDDVCLLYVRRQGANEDLASRAGYYAVDPKHTPYFDLKHPDEALLELRRAAAAAPASFLPHFLEGDLLLRLKRFDESRSALERSLRLSPGHAASCFDLGLLAQQVNRPEEAEHCLRRVIRLRNDQALYALACYHLGALLSATPLRRTEALRWAREAVRALPEWEQGKQLLNRLEQ